MPPPDAKENQVLTTLVTVLNSIGTPSTSWLTAPAVFEGIPPDPAEAGLYVHHFRSEALPEQATRDHHVFRAYFAVFCLAQDTGTGYRDVVKMKADVLRAVFAAEQTFQQSYGLHLEPTDYQYRDDMERAGFAVGAQVFTIDLPVSHTEP